MPPFHNNPHDCKDFLEKLRKTAKILTIVRIIYADTH